MQTFERNFSIRQVNASTWAHPEVGLNYAADPGYIGTLDGVTATVTPEGKAAELRYLAGPVGFEDADATTSESYGYLATPLAGANFKTLVGAPIPGTAQTGSLVGVYSHDGREELVITFVYNQYQEQFQFLAHGIISWMTRGHPPGLRAELLRRAHRRRVPRGPALEQGRRLHAGRQLQRRRWTRTPSRTRRRS